MTNDITTPSCPYCFQTTPGSTLTTPSLRVGTEEDVLDAEIERVEKLISSLFLERSRLYRKRNEMRSPIYSLPQEILILIFKFACPRLDFLQMYGLDSSFPEDPHPRIIGVLAAVSVRWHNVVSSTPSLWASFIVDDWDITAMHAILSRSGNLPVLASFKFPYSSASSEHYTALLAPVLRENSSRIRMLHLYNASPTWLKEHIPSYVKLELLCLEHIEDGPVVIDSPCTSLVLKKISPPISFPSSHIEVLHLSSMPTNDCLELLKKCPRLREYRLRDPNDSKLEGWQLPASPFILSNLELFEWMVDDRDPVDRAMLKYIRMPTLQTLVWNEKFSNLEPSEFLSSFFEHLPSTLSAVEVQNSRSKSDFSSFSYFLNLSNVERLTFTNCGDRFMDGVFGDLGSETCLVGNQEMPVLPKLKSTYVDHCNGNLDQAKILKTFQCRCSQPLESLQGSPFRLEFAMHRVDWTPEFKKELIRMVEEGYQMELLEDSKPVDWSSGVKLPQK